MLFPAWRRSSPAVAVAAMVEEGHAGRSYLLTGPQALTPERRARVIGEAVGREIRFEEVTVEQVTGRPGRTFAQWAAEHAAAFRS
ncbi:hypothetical protein AB0392_52325 [Nonomuraea angiospora]|uniref:hypothetical protein n=1 Tax=Nonomuraea angiospora TaxID=46172 RepID=UPI00344F3438